MISLSNALKSNAARMKEKELSSKINEKAGTATLWKAGIDDKDCPANFDKSKLSYYKTQNISDASRPMLKSYCSLLSRNEISFGNYFTPEETEIYVLTQKLAKAKFGTGNAELTINHINAHYNPIRRMLEGTSQCSSEKSNQEKVQKSFYENTKLKNGTNILKDIAWICPHAYLTGLFMNYAQMASLIKKVRDTEAWNRYIGMQIDVPDSVKNLFYIEDGRCGFLDYFEKNSEKFTNEQKGNHMRRIYFSVPASFKEATPKTTSATEKKNIIERYVVVEKKPESVATSVPTPAPVVVDPAAYEHPEDDPPEVDEIDSHVIHLNTTNPEKPQTPVTNPAPIQGITFGEALQNAIKPEDPTTTVAMPTVDSPAPTVEEKKQEQVQKLASVVMQAVQQAKEEIKPVETPAPAVEVVEAPVVVEEKKPEPVVEEVKAEVVEVVAEKPQIHTVDFSENNKSFHAIPKLEIFTKIVNDMGYHVFYKRNEDKYRGLINAEITGDTGALIKTLVIDPYMVYGDNLRIVTNEREDGDLRKETFIPISMDDVIKKVIVAPLTKEDKRLVNSKLPKEILNYRPKYNFLDRVDMKGLSSDGKFGLPFEDWCKLVENIGMILTNKNLPIARYRIGEYINPNKFRLVADQFATAHFNSGIFSEKSNAEAVVANTTIFADFSVYDYKSGVAAYNVYNLPPQNQVVVAPVATPVVEEQNQQ